jgi:hypothetical protein
MPLRMKLSKKHIDFIAYDCCWYQAKKKGRQICVCVSGSSCVEI